IPGERAAYLWGAPLGRLSRKTRWKETVSDSLHRRLVLNTFSQDERLWSEIYRKLVRFEPRTVVGYVSSLRGFSAFLQERKLKLMGIEAVIAAAEPLFRGCREQIEAGFGAPIFNTYGAREFMSIAGECDRRQGLHVNAENILLETAEPD